MRLTCVDRFPLRFTLLNKVEQLPRHHTTRIALKLGPTLRDNIVSRVRSLDSLIPLTRPPLLNLLDLLLIQRILRLTSLIRLSEELETVGWELTGDRWRGWDEGCHGARCGGDCAEERNGDGWRRESNATRSGGCYAAKHDV